MDGGVESSMPASPSRTPGRGASCWAHVQPTPGCTRRHGFLLSAVTLQGPEKLGYYVLLLEQILKAYKGAHGRRLEQIFIDVACRFGPSIQR